MKLIFIRHGLAEGNFSLDQEMDFDRVLTLEGIRRLEEIFKTFIKFEDNIDIIFSSPLARAIQTAEILWESYKKADLELMSDLDILDDPSHLVEYINFLPADGTYAFVGHDPHLTRVIASLLALHPEHDFMKIKKGGICVLEGRLLDGFNMELLISPKFLKKIED